MSKLAFQLTGTTLTRTLDGVPMPVTITFESADPSRLIQINTDGREFFTPAASLDETTATRIVFTVFSKITAVKVTGVPGDILTLEGS
jgi:hypothetical protein